MDDQKCVSLFSSELNRRTKSGTMQPIASAEIGSLSRDNLEMIGASTACEMVNGIF